MGDSCVLCGQSRFTLTALLHIVRDVNGCSSPQGRSKKEIAKTTVSFWLRKTISRAYELSGTALPVPAPRARETRGIAQSILFRKNFAVDQVLKAGTWRRHTTFTRHYLRDIAHKSLDTFHLGPVVSAQSVV